MRRLMSGRGLGDGTDLGEDTEKTILGISMLAIAGSNVERRSVVQALLRIMLGT